MRHRSLSLVLLSLGIAAVGVAMSDALSWMTTRALRAPESDGSRRN